MSPVWADAYVMGTIGILCASAVYPALTAGQIAQALKLPLHAPRHQAGPGGVGWASSVRERRGYSAVT
jgi:hypothetical protein